MSLGSRFNILAKRLLTQYGRTFSAVREVEGAFNPSTGATGSATVTSYSGVAYPRNYRTDEIDGIVVEQGDIELILHSNTPPLIGDVITITSVEYRAMSVQIITADAVNVIYRVQVRV